MAKSLAEAREEDLRLGRTLLQMLGQEDTLKSIESAIGAGGVTQQILDQLDIKTSQLRDGLRGTGVKDFTTLETDIESVLARLNVNLSTRSSEAGQVLILTQLDLKLSAFRDGLRGLNTKDFSTLEADVEAVLAKLDVALSTRASETTLASILGRLNINLSTRASQTTLASILGQLNITSSVFRDALRGASTKDFTTLETELAKKVNGATTRATYNITMTLADTEYPQVLPGNCLKFLLHTRDGTEFRLASETGKVAVPSEPYLTILANVPYWEDFIKPTTMTLYFACGSVGKVVELVVWS